MALTTLLCALAGTSLQAVPATAALQQVIIVESLDAGFPPLIYEDPPDRMEIAPAGPISAEKANGSHPAAEGRKRG